MTKKDLGLLILIIVVGAIVASINPRFLRLDNLANTANTDWHVRAFRRSGRRSSS